MSPRRALTALTRPLAATGAALMVGCSPTPAPIEPPKGMTLGAWTVQSIRAVEAIPAQPYTLTEEDKAKCAVATIAINRSLDRVNQKLEANVDVLEQHALAVTDQMGTTGAPLPALDPKFVEENAKTLQQALQLTVASQRVRARCAGTKPR